MALEMLCRMDDQLPRAISSARWGIIMVESAFVMVKGMKSSGITIPDIMPNSDTAWLFVMPLAAKRRGTRMLLMEFMEVIIILVKVKGTAMEIMFLRSKENGEVLALLPRVLMNFVE
ncbi:hypothetical protein JOD02_000862 [Caldicoprobacter guelmensis]|nr:hypothetical protein [Caldicoprobacter guelmensis]MBM7582025.1 hypothetical protein [Caldicoprobacter guelmensis]